MRLEGARIGACGTGVPADGTIGSRCSSPSSAGFRNGRSKSGDLALAENPEPAYLVETLPAALRKVTGHDYEVLDRTTSDVTGSFVKASVMIRDGAVGLWPGYAARAYPLLARDARTEQARAAIAAGAPGGEGEARKPGWEPPPPVIKRRPTGTRAPAEVGQDAAQASE